MECAVKQCSDMELTAVFTRRDPTSVTILTPGVPAVSYTHLDVSKRQILHYGKRSPYFAVAAGSMSIP